AVWVSAPKCKCAMHNPPAVASDSPVGLSNTSPRAATSLSRTATPPLQLQCNTTQHPDARGNRNLLDGHTPLQTRPKVGECWFLDRGKATMLVADGRSRCITGGRQWLS